MEAMLHKLVVDSLELYRWAVQDPETHAELLRIMYTCTRPGRRAELLREDFAGTAADSVAWVALREGRRAVAVDLHGPTVAWAKLRAERILGDRASSIEFATADVIDSAPPEVPAADILSVLNYSLFYLKEQAALQAYLRHAIRCLARNGLLVMNLFGGPDAMRPNTWKHTVNPAPRLPSEEAPPPFDYIWEQRAYDPVSATLDCRIHFEIPGVCEVRDAFCYDWRLWRPMELIDELHAAGFDDVEVWRHTYDSAVGPASLFLGPVPLSELDSLDYWTAYILAAR